MSAEVTVTIPFYGQVSTFRVKRRNLAEILTPRPAPAIENLEAALQETLSHPVGQERLQEWIKPGDRILLVCDDNTRLTPADRLLPPLVQALNQAGVPDGQISVLMALGTHRPMTKNERLAKVGPDLFRRLKVFNHEWDNSEKLIDMGTTKHGTPIHVNRAAQEPDVILGIGAIVPHHISGFSGSSKIIQPGICGAVTTAETHLLSARADVSLLGLERNPVREEMDEMADRVGMKTLLNVVLTSEGLVAGIYFGEMRSVFKKGVELATTIYGVYYHEEPDIVVANSFPCDLDFWQAHKSLYSAAMMVRRGGTIIVVTPAPEGISSTHSSLLTYTPWSSERIEMAYRRGQIEDGVGAALAIAWARVREKAGVIMVSPGISAPDKAKLGFTHADDMESALSEAFRRQGSQARVSILTHASETLPMQKHEPASA